MDNLLNQIKIIFENEGFLAINKPAGLLVHPTPGRSDEITLVDWIKKERPEIIGVGDFPDGGQNRPGIVHRLDKDTSGVMIIVKNNQAFAYFKKLFQEKNIHKSYRALTWGNFDQLQGTIDKPIGRVASSSKHSTSAKKLKDIKEAITDYRVLKNYKETGKQGFSFLEVFPRTGRTNQIRVHLASIGHSVVGDPLYGSKKLKLPDGLNRMFLHAFSLEFSLENNKMMRLEADLPDDLQKTIDFLDKSQVNS